jgi:hypothetical protein
LLDRASDTDESDDFAPSLCVALCCDLPLIVASKGQGKGNEVLAISDAENEALELRIEIGQVRVATYMVRDRRPPSQTWRT